LYDVIAPFAGRNAAIAGAVSFGSVELVLARLAASLERWDPACEHFERALAFNIRTRQQVWVARTRWHFADMLAARGERGVAARADDLRRIAHDDAREAGMVLPETPETPS
jgi:hypothetical protein